LPNFRYSTLLSLRALLEASIDAAVQKALGTERGRFAGAPKEF
jgi:hypothetical protein